MSKTRKKQPGKKASPKGKILAFNYRKDCMNCRKPAFISAVDETGKKVAWCKKCWAKEVKPTRGRTQRAKPGRSR